MKANEANGEIDNKGNLRLDYPLVEREEGQSDHPYS